jgi:hypothetical protein
MTPSVSLMANSSEVFALGDLHLTVGLSNSSIARGLVKTAGSHLKAKKFTYITIVNEDCVFCLDLGTRAFVKLVSGEGSGFAAPIVIGGDKLADCCSICSHQSFE